MNLIGAITTISAILAATFPGGRLPHADLEVIESIHRDVLNGRAGGLKRVPFIFYTKIAHTMIFFTQIVRLDGLSLVASTDDRGVPQLDEFKQQTRQVIKKLNSASEPRASIESSDNYTMHYLINDNITFLCITEATYPKKLAQTYLEDIRKEFQNNYQREAYLDPMLRPYPYAEFERYIERTKKTYQDSRAQQNLQNLNEELKDVSSILTKNVNDLLYRGDSLEKMGDMSSRLREDSAKYKRAAVRINWELLLKQYGPIAGLATIIVVFLIWRFFY